MDGEVAFFVEGNQALVRLLRSSFQGAGEALQARGFLHGGGGQFAVELHLGFAALKDNGAPAEHLTRHKEGVLQLHEGPKSTIVVLNVVMLPNLPDIGMDPRHTDVVANPNITRRIPANLQTSFIFRIQNKKDLLLRELFPLVSRGQSLKDDEVVFGTFNFYDVYDVVIYVHGEGEFLLAQFAVYLFVFYYNVVFNCF